MSVSRKDLESPNTYPVGEYEFEIKGAEMVTGVGRDDKPWKQVVVKTIIISPEKLAGKFYTFRLFLDNRLGKMITVGLGKSLDDVFGKNDQIDDSKLIDVLNGSFFKARLGVKNGYNEIVEFLSSSETKKNTPETV